MQATSYNRFRMDQRAIPHSLFDECGDNPTIQRPARDGRTFHVLEVPGTDWCLVLVMGNPDRDPDPVVTCHWALYQPNSRNGWGWLPYDNEVQHRVGCEVQALAASLR